MLYDFYCKNYFLYLPWRFARLYEAISHLFTIMIPSSNSLGPLSWSINSTSAISTLLYAGFKMPWNCFTFSFLSSIYFYVIKVNNSMPIICKAIKLYNLIYRVAHLSTQISQNLWVLEGNQTTFWTKVIWFWEGKKIGRLVRSWMAL